MAFVDKLANYNDGIKYLLVAVDVLSRYVRVQPMKTKTAPATVEAFKKMLKSGKQPEKLWTDKGTEFRGEFAKFCEKRKIHSYSTNSETKSAFAERNIRSLKNIISRYLEEQWTWRYIDHLQDFVKTINTRVNRVTKLAPTKVTKAHVPFLVSLAFTNKSIKRPKFKVGDTVRIARKDIPFRKGYQQNFTDELFQIAELLTSNPPTYAITDHAGERILGKFYEAELIKVTT